MSKKTASETWIKFLGTAGARFVMIKQLRASGGLWVRAGKTNVVIDPGPGSIVRCAASRPKLDPTTLDGIILTHRHLDHANDANVMIEAMTEGGFKKRGAVFVPQDALGADPVILKHALGFIERLEVLTENKDYAVGDFEFQTTGRLRHSCETYGLKFSLKGNSIALLTDTEYFDGLIDQFKADVLILNVVFYQARSGVQHLCLADAKRIIEALRPAKVILTHFGMSMLAAKPHLLAKQIGWETGVDVIAAADGMTVSF
ncbi:MAG: MBL fold metallo-hydrolase [Candidatus Omnitrophota bacterium]